MYIDKKRGGGNQTCPCMVILPVRRASAPAGSHITAADCVGTQILTPIGNSFWFSARHFVALRIGADRKKCRTSAALLNKQ